jgi:signal transduction histidine kinase
VRRVTGKWRPRLSVIVLVILVAVLALPLFGMFFFRLYENQLVRQAESELIAQGAALSAVYVRELRNAGVRTDQLGAPVPADALPAPGEPYNPIEPSLDLAADDVFGLRPQPTTAETAALPVFSAVGATLTEIMGETQETTLAGFRLLDPNGTVIGGSDEVGLSLAHIPEVSRALAGRYASTMRVRILNRDPPPVYSMSRGTSIRVFIAMPAVLDGRVAGVFYLSRTPNNVIKHLYGERGKVALAASAILLTTLLIGFVFVRTISRPMHELIDRTQRIAAGDREAIRPLSHHGTREMALLGAAFLDMSRKLQARSDALKNFATHVSHELKSPLTSIQGAAELLRDSGGDMNDDERRRFSQNIVSDAGRMAGLVRHLLELARAETVAAGDASASVAEALELVARPAGLAISMSGEDLRCRMSPQNLAIVLGNLAENSAQHGATQLAISAEVAEDDIVIALRDDGEGILPGNRDRIFDPFFTTRREKGGTGVGLSIVAALVHGHGGKVQAVESERGAAFEITLPAA